MRRAFLFVETLTGAWAAMRDEALALPERHFLPWLQRGMYDEGWSVVPLCWSGRDIDTMRERCPRTLAALDAVPGLAMAVFSRLAPGTRIAPHVGWGYRVYRLHVGLVVPQGCWLEVAGERRAWREGGCLIFEPSPHIRPRIRRPLPHRAQPPRPRWAAHRAASQ